MKRDLLQGTVFAGLLMLLAGCDQAPPLAPAGDLQAYVPADTPYAFVVSRPLPEPLRTRLAEQSAQQLAAQRRSLDTLRQNADQDPASSGPHAAAFFGLLDALFAEFEGRDTAAQLRELGIEPVPRSAVFGIGILPAVRSEIADATALEAMLDRVEARSGHHAQRGQLGDQAYRRIDLGRVDAVIAVTPEHLVAGLLPDERFDADLPLLLGQDRPDESLAGTRAIETLIARHDFTGHGEGFIELDTVLDMLLGRAAGHHAAVLEAVGAEPLSASPACQSLLTGLVAGMPRMAFGITEAGADRLAVRGIWESAPAVTPYLRTLASPVPGLGEDFDGLLAMGVGIDLPQLRGAIDSLLRYVMTAGSECEWVDAEALRKAIPQLNLVLGPMTAGIRGFNLRFEGVEIDPESLQPTAIQASLLAAVDDPRGVFALGAMFNPGLAALEIPTDGTPVPLPRDLLADAQSPPVSVAIRGKALALVTGEDPAAAADRLFGGATVVPAPLFALDYGVRRLMERFDAVLASAPERLAAQGEVELAENLRVQLDDFRRQAEVFERLRVALFANEQGLVMDQVMELR